VLCGAISQYNATGPRRGIENTSALITRRARMEGFLILDYASRFTEAQGALAGLVLSGEIQHQEDVLVGLERAPEALNRLLSGGNHGKMLVAVDESVRLG
jgi:NADPH-dependent curcumin reductase